MVTKPYTFVAGTKAKSAEVNSDFDTLYTEVNAQATSIASIQTDIEDIGNNKANTNGNYTQKFQVANPENSYDAYNKQSFNRDTYQVRNYIDGLVISKDTGSPYDTILVTAGECWDSTYSVVMKLSTSVTKQNTGQGASTTYYVYLVSNDTSTQTQIIISSVSDNPSLPSGYTLFRCIGKYTTASSIYNNRAVKIYNYSNSYKQPSDIDYANKKAITFLYSTTEVPAPYYYYDVMEDGYMYVAIDCTDRLQHVYCSEAPVVSGCGYSGGKAVIHSSIFKVSAGDRIRYTSSLADTAYYYPLK